MLKIIIGLFILTIMVFLHELGHFIAAKLSGVVVESFSIGWGPVIFKKKIGTTEYRISAIPMGGYCGMKGENSFKEAIEKRLSEIPAEKGSLYSVNPLKRICIAFSGPFANYLTAVLAMAVVSAIGTSYYTSSNRIAPVYYYDNEDESPARVADLKLGDKIISINGNKTETFADITKLIIPAANEKLDFVIDREGTIILKTVIPKLDTSTGAGVVGFYSYIPLEIEKVMPNSSSAIAELLKGDIILKVNGKDVANTIDLNIELQKLNTSNVEVMLLRNGETILKNIPIVRTENGIDLGIEFKYLKVDVEGTGFLDSILNGVSLTNKMCVLTLKSFTLPFKGVDLKKAVSGPLRITHMIGDTAAHGFAEGFLTGIFDMLNFISLISVSLFIMNLLPIPVLDGGLILLALTELLSRKKPHPKILYYVQFIGFGFIAVVFIFALWSDISFFIR